MSNRRELERDVIEAARQIHNGGCESPCAGCRAVAALDSCPPEPAARAFTMQQEVEIDRRVGNAFFALEARLNGFSMRLHAIESPPAPAPQPEAKRMTNERRYDRARTYCATSAMDEGHLTREAFLREAREIEVQAMKEVQAKCVGWSDVWDIIDRLIEKRSKP